MDPVSRHETGGLWEGGVGRELPSSGDRDRKQGVQLAGHGVGRGAEKDPERQECKGKQMPSL